MRRSRPFRSWCASNARLEPRGMATSSHGQEPDGSKPMLGGLFRREVAKACHQNPVLLAPPAAVVKPERVTMMMWTLWPSRVDEKIVDILLSVLHDSFNVRVGLVNEPPQTLRVFEDKPVVCCSNGRVEVAEKQVNHASLVGVSHRHLVMNRC